MTRALAVAKRIDTGTCHIKGGVRDSGYGRLGGRAATDVLTGLRRLTIRSGYRHYPVWGARAARWPLLLQHVGSWRVGQGRQAEMRGAHGRRRRRLA